MIDLVLQRFNRARGSLECLALATTTARPSP
jgi:hypothetical protein